MKCSEYVERLAASPEMLKRIKNLGEVTGMKQFILVERLLEMALKIVEENHNQLV